MKTHQIKSSRIFHCWNPPHKIRVIQRGIQTIEAAHEWGLKQAERWPDGETWWIKREEKVIFGTLVFIPQAVEVDLSKVEAIA